MKKKVDSFGVGALIIAYLSYVIMLILFVGPIPYKTEVFLAMTYICLPSLVGTILYSKLSSTNFWRESEK